MPALPPQTARSSPVSNEIGGTRALRADIDGFFRELRRFVAGNGLCIRAASTRDSGNVGAFEQATRKQSGPVAPRNSPMLDVPSCTRFVRQSADAAQARCASWPEQLTGPRAYSCDLTTGPTAPSRLGTKALRYSDT